MMKRAIAVVLLAAAPAMAQPQLPAEPEAAAKPEASPPPAPARKGSAAVSPASVPTTTTSTSTSTSTSTLTGSDGEKPVQTAAIDGISAEEIDALIAAGEIVEVSEKRTVTPGATHRVGDEDLRRFSRDDVHRALAGVAGVYIREEEGHGLRPNIGMRGASAERSAKIALLEDGIPIAPAPYSAPAAYYFPLVARLAAIDVVKGPSAIQHGPNTVGGAVDLVTRPIPFAREVAADSALGGFGYGKLHGRFGDRFRRGGLLVEGTMLHSDGFKQLDGGGGTGFDRRDVIAKGRVTSDPDRPRFHQLDLELGWGDEASDETYTGLSDGDLLVTPYRRYAATQLDHMTWVHTQLRLRHRYEHGDRFALTTTGYRHDFDRTWRKLDGFRGGRPLAQILGAPDSGANQIYYQVLTGEADSASPAEALLLGVNDRRFVSQGVQSELTTRLDGPGGRHELTAGLRVHQDSARRRHDDEVYAMMGGQLVADGNAPLTTLDATGSALALAGFVRDQLTWRNLTITAGLRTEVIATRERDHLTEMIGETATQTVLLPGAGAFYALGEHLGVLAGVHRGFVPTAPGQADRASPEQSVNYEAGLRGAWPAGTAEAIGFVSDYQNLKGTCSFSSGCAGGDVESEFDGGAVRVWGAELSASAEPRLAGTLSFPLAVAYTFTDSRFGGAFESDNPQWGEVEIGDRLPYVPRHQLSLTTAVRARRFELAATARSTGELRDVAGQGPIADGERIPGHTVFDLAAHALLGRLGELYLTVDNVADQAYLVSRRPYGARPGKPRTAVLGWRGSF
jgi:Fe(3+) dicitrate transport protein